MSAVADDRLLYETRWRMRIAVAAIGGGLLLLVASLLQLVGPHSNVNELTIGLIEEHKRFPLDLIANIVQAVAWAGIAVALKFLFDSVRARKPEINAAFVWILVFGAVVIALSGIVSAIVIAIKAHQFVTTGNQTYQQANHLTSGPLLAVLSYSNLVGLLAAAVGVVLVALNSMRVGLLTRFMGYVGIFAGVLILFVVTPVPVVQAYWLVALGYLISGRWPSGLPPAWMSGQAQPWPSSQAQRDQRMRQRGSTRGQRPGTAGQAGAPFGGLFRKRAPAESAPVPVEAPTGGTRATTPKRKRKRRK
ncbi:MAG TPA: DUF4386 family protein [Solirubrobacteraceae bacterium]|nr:DUF4386 family protein [Solirubrobacteraceae bacterium]